MYDVPEKEGLPLGEHQMIYAIADPHGCLAVLEKALQSLDLAGANHLYLLGDYIPHEKPGMSTGEYLSRCEEALRYVKGFQESHPGCVDVLKGNHELMLLERVDEGELELDRRLVGWSRGLPVLAETERQIFVHAGIDEEAGEWWRWGCDDWYLCSKFPPSFGLFEKDIVAGHVSTCGLAGEVAFRGVYWDGASHYYLDGTTERTGCMPILCYDVLRGRYLQRLATAEGVSDLMPVDAAGMQA